MADKMQFTAGGTTITLTPTLEPVFNRSDQRIKGHFQSRNGQRQYWQTGSAYKSDVSLNNISKADADQLNTWWRSLSIITFTPNTDEPGTTLPARISPGGQAPLQMWFDTGFQDRYAGTITIVEVSSSSSSSGS